MLKNNKGFTLVEVIIVVAIIAVLSSAAVVTTYQVSSTNAKQTANEIAGMLSRCRMSTLSGMVDPYLEISGNNGDITATLFANGHQIEIEEVATNAVNVSFTIGGTTTEMTGNQSLTIRYDTSGAITSPMDIQTITASSGSKRYTINIVAATGYHEVN